MGMDVALFVCHGASAALAASTDVITSQSVSNGQRLLGSVAAEAVWHGALTDRDCYALPNTRDVWPHVASFRRLTTVRGCRLWQGGALSNFGGPGTLKCSLFRNNSAFIGVGCWVVGSCVHPSQHALIEACPD